MLSKRDALAIFESELRRLQGEFAGIDPTYPRPSDWAELFRRDSNTEWLVANLWPVGRQCHMHAARKTGKSLVSLWIAAELACGRDPFTGAPIRPVRVGYLDFEMTEDDLLERVEAMGYKAEDLGNLFYFMHPTFPMLDTKAGGEMLLATLTAYGVEAVVIDTMSRVVAGEENSNDTYIRFYKHTGALLKAAGIAMLRLDHEGHESGRSRGASSKADDVDIVWQLTTTDTGLLFVRKAARMAWIPEKLAVARETEPTLRFASTHEAWPAGTLEKAQELDTCDVPLDMSRRKAAEALKTAGFTPGKLTVLLAAMRYRQQRVLGI